MLTRRLFLRQSVAALAASRALAAQAPPSSLVESPAGRFQGEARDGLRIFRGVPFARPPVGPLRFRPPQPLAPASGTVDCTRFAAAAMQPGQPEIPQSEDCLYLNLWAPQDARNAPVFVWIHGGGFTGGRSFDPLADGARFASSSIVCITLAYRLGVFGFMDMAPLLGESYAGSASNGLRDLIAALQWIQRNVASFGGDPARVTIGGESAGAKLSDLLMGIPAAQPLFHQVISESGGAERIWPQSGPPPRNAQAAAEAFGRQWTADTPGRSLRQLRDAPASQLIAAQQRFIATFPVHFPLRPALDPTLIPQPPLAAIRAGNSRGKRLLLGTNHDESAFFLGPHPTAEPTAADLGNLSLDQFRLIEDRYRRLAPTLTPEALHIRAVTAEEYWVPSMRVLEAHLAGGGQAFVYRLDFPDTGRFAGLSPHAFDVRFVWDILPASATPAPARQLARQMHTAWVAFILGQTPAGEPFVDYAGFHEVVPLALPAVADQLASASIAS